MSDQRAEEIRELMVAARAETRGLFEMAREEDLRQSPGFGFRPVIWHLGHIGVFESYWLLQKVAGQPSPDERYERIFDPIKTPREESTNLPSRREMESYLARVRDEVFRVLDRATFDDADPLLRDAYVFHLVLEHEYQHQETLAYLLHLLAPATKTRPSRDGAREQGAVAEPPALNPSPAMITIPEGAFRMGAVWNSFAYDNELPPHVLELPSFKIDRLLTTNSEYAHFVEEGGYRRREWWSDEGWEWRERENWTMPLYWSQEGAGRWRAREMFDEGVLAPAHPVTGISWYEAEAYARFTGKRLPTEAEWEKAASWQGSARAPKRRFSWGETEPSPALCNSNNYFWGTTSVGSFPEGASASACLDMTGNVWEWTADAFEPFPGFEPFPYPEYSAVWFDGDHRVLKGGSWATRSSVLRTSFRNFFRRHFRIAFAGLRCASHA
ncbi:MAG TPA: SUMF1/EgtB/PvdO family nonheme iron enzyme [Pyrinomonadaceae bacterium]|nr:SUMF1/EgtB/PvdO family nonheme iron enzyme [Pyrinomonadaceae bacterium]